MIYEDLLKTVKAKLPTWKMVTANVIQMRYRCLQMAARKCIADLQAEGLIGTEWDSSLGGYPVLTGEKHGV